MKRGDWVATEKGRVVRVLSVTPTGRLKVDEHDGRLYRPDGIGWMWQGGIYGRFGHRDSRELRLPTPEEIAAGEQREAAERDRLETMARECQGWRARLVGVQWETIDDPHIRAVARTLGWTI